jgi:hypothetical protein
VLRLGHNNLEADGLFAKGGIVNNMLREDLNNNTSVGDVQVTVVRE